MPKSKRAKVVPLTKVAKKGKELNIRLYANVREAVDRHQYCFVFSGENMRNTYLSDLRAKFDTGRIFFGKTKVMAKALGLTVEEEYHPGLSDLSQYISGQVGLLLTPCPPEEVIDYLHNYVREAYATIGTIASQDWVIPAGLLYSHGGAVPDDQDQALPVSLDSKMRNLGMPIRMDRGKLMLDQEYRICTEGDVLDARQTKLLNQFGVQLAEFRARPLAYWSAATGTVKEVEGLER